MKRPTHTLATLIGGAAMIVGAAVLGSAPALATTPEPQSATASQGLISGPLVEGPLVDLGELLGDIQVGQFQ